MNFSTLVTISALAASANAFWGTSHLLVARQAQAILESSGSGAYDKAITELATLKKYYPSITTDEGTHPFTECASFADDIKGQGYKAQSDWHFIDQPYYSDAGTGASDFPDFVYPASVDVISAITTCVDLLKGNAIDADNLYLQQLQEWFSYEDDQKSFALRLIIHYVGDIHQPLHAVSEVSSQFTDGDRGGNDEWVPNKDGAGNMHAVWDSVMYTYEGYPNTPLNDTDWDWFTTTAADLMVQFPVEQSKVNAGQFQEWADEGLKMAIDVTYNNWEFNTALTQDYIDVALPALQQHMMYGSARLAALIEDIYGDSNQEIFLQ